MDSFSIIRSLWSSLLYSQSETFNSDFTKWNDVGFTISKFSNMTTHPTFLWLHGLYNILEYDNGNLHHLCLLLFFLIYFYIESNLHTSCTVFSLTILIKIMISILQNFLGLGLLQALKRCKLKIEIWLCFSVDKFRLPQCWPVGFEPIWSCTGLLALCYNLSYFRVTQLLITYFYCICE